MAKPASHDPSSITAVSDPDPDVPAPEPLIVPDCSPGSAPVTDEPSPFVVVGVASPIVVGGVGVVVVGADSLDDF